MDPFYFDVWWGEHRRNENTTDISDKYFLHENENSPSSKNETSQEIPRDDKDCKKGEVHTPEISTCFLGRLTPEKKGGFCFWGLSLIIIKKNIKPIDMLCMDLKNFSSINWWYDQI